MKRIFILIMLFSLPLLSSCKNDETIKIGFAGQISGVNSELGVDARYAAKLAVNEINDNGGINGKKLELIVKDDKGNPETAVKVDNELKDEGCVAIIGHGLSQVYESIIANANKNDILLISPTISTVVADNLDDNLIRIIPSNQSQGEDIGAFASISGTESVIVVIEQTNISYTGNLSSAFINTYESLGGTVSEDDILTFYSGDDSSYLDVSEKINASNINKILLIGSSYDVGTIIQKIDNYEEKEIYMPIWPSTREIFALSGVNLEGTYATNYFNFSSTNTTYVTLQNKYFEEYGKEISFSALFSYEAVYVLSKALESIKDYTPSKIKDAIINIGTFQGVMDTFSINEFGDTSRKMYYFRLLDGEFVEIPNEND